MIKFTDTAALLIKNSRRQFMAGTARIASLAMVLPAVMGGRTIFGAAMPDSVVKTGVSYFGSRDPRHLRQDMKDIAAHHCNFVVHTFSEADYYFYTKAMKEAVAVSHDMGLDVYLDPWGVGGVFGGEAFSRFVMENPEQCQRQADGSALPCACLNREAFRAFMKKWVDAAVDTGADCLFWDEPHFYIPRAVWRGAQRPDEWACTCEACRELFKRRFGYTMPKIMNGDIVLFRDESIVSFFAEMTGYAKGKGVKNALCVLPDENPLIGISSWEKLAAVPGVDIFGTDPYWIVFGKPVEDYVRTAAKKIAALSARYGKEPQMWVQAYGVPAGREKEVAQAVRVIADEGIRNIAAWSYRGGAPMNLASANPERVWEVLGKAYREVRS
ncbi:MAG: hypothetical protein JW765_09300 [Deltaproteobacteria bacterium]|nr:hypothetical protein [Candidatus Zymogenaceae bacterium]